MGATEIFWTIVGVGVAIGLGVGIAGVVIGISFKIVETIVDWFDYHF